MNDVVYTESDGNRSLVELSGYAGAMFDRMNDPSRDRFTAACAALTGLLANPNICAAKMMGSADRFGVCGDETQRGVVLSALAIADALLAASEAEPTP